MSCSHKLPRDKIGEYHEKKREMSRGHAVNSKYRVMTSFTRIFNFVIVSGLGVRGPLIFDTNLSCWCQSEKQRQKHVLPS